MRAIEVAVPGGPEAMAVVEVAEPRPGPGDLLVDVEAAGVNFIDVYHRGGVYPRPTPIRLGQEGAGVVVEVGDEVTEFRAGDRVAWALVPGGYAQRAVVPAEVAVAVPDDVDAHTAAAVMVQGLTAHYLVDSAYPVRRGDTVLVHAAAGGTGLLLTQSAQARGARVIGTVSTVEKEKLARENGVDEIIRYTEADVVAAVRALTDGAGVHAVYDGVGRSTFDTSLACLRRRGTLVLFGASSGPVPPMDPQRLNAAGSVYLTRPSLADFIVDRRELTNRSEQIFDALRNGLLQVRVHQVYPMSEVQAAHRDLESRATTGKLLLDPNR